MEFFLNPWSMVAGGALISAPILIHLINRLRFKDLAQLAAQSEIDQYLRVVLLSTRDVLFEGDPKEGDALNQLETRLNALTPKLIHASPREGLKKCKALLEQPPLSKEEREA